MGSLPVAQFLRALAPMLCATLMTEFPRPPTGLWACLQLLFSTGPDNISEPSGAFLAVRNL